MKTLENKGNNLTNSNNTNDKRELSAKVQEVKSRKNEEVKNKDLQFSAQDTPENKDSEVLSNFTQSNFLKNREPKLHSQPKLAVTEPIIDIKSKSVGAKSKDKSTADAQQLFFPDADMKFDTQNLEEFFTKHWVELIEVCSGLLNDIFLKVGNVQISEEANKLFSHIKTLSNKSVVYYIYEKLFSRQKLSLDQNWFKNKDRIETLEKQKQSLKKELIELQRLLEVGSDYSQSITSLPQKSKHGSIEGEQTTSRNKVDSDLKAHDTAEFGQKTKREEPDREHIINSASKTHTLRSKQEDSFPSKLIEDGLQPPIKQEDDSGMPDRRQSITMRGEEYKTEERVTTQQSVPENNKDARTNFNRTISKMSRVSHNTKINSKMSQKFYRGKGKMSIKDELQMYQEIKDLETDKAELEGKCDQLAQELEEQHHDSVKWKSIMSQKIVELEDSIRKLKMSNIRENNSLKDKYAKDLLRVSKMSKQREQSLIQNIKKEIESEYEKKIENLKAHYDRLSYSNQKYENLQEKYNMLTAKEEELRDEYERIMKKRAVEDFKKN